MARLSRSFLRPVSLAFVLLLTATPALAVVDSPAKTAVPTIAGRLEATAVNTWVPAWLAHFDADGDRIDDRAEAMAAATPTSQAEDTDAVPASLDLLVTFDHWPTVADLSAAADIALVAYEYQTIPTLHLTVRASTAALADVAALDGVVAVERLTPVEKMLSFAAPATQAREFAGTGANAVYNGNTAEALGYTGSGMVIAVLDTGVNDAHPAFAGKWITGAVTSSPTSTSACVNPADEDGHGTHVAGIALGNQNGNANKGGAKDARLVEIKISAGPATVGGDSRGFDWVLAYNNAIDAGSPLCGVSAGDRIDVATLSFGSTAPGGPNAGAVEGIINQLTQKGVVVTIAVGNCGPSPSDTCTDGGFSENGISSPGNAAGAVSVAAVDDLNTVSRSNDVVAGYSSRGPNEGITTATITDRYRKPEVAAPGSGISSASTFYPAITYIEFSGTSMATPLTAGLSALLVQAGEEAKAQTGGVNLMKPTGPGYSGNTNWVPGQHPVRDALLRTTDYVTTGVSSTMLSKWESAGAGGRTWNNAYGYGETNVFAALCWAWANVLQPGGATPSTTLAQKCGLDGGASPPTASAGGPYSGPIGQAVTVTGTAAGGTPPYSFQWAVLSAPAGSTATFANQNAATTTFTPDAAGTYTIRFTVQDDAGQSASATTGLTASTIGSGQPGDEVPLGTDAPGDRAVAGGTQFGPAADIVRVGAGDDAQRFYLFATMQDLAQWSTAFHVHGDFDATWANNQHYGVIAAVNGPTSGSGVGLYTGIAGAGARISTDVTVTISGDTVRFGVLRSDIGLPPTGATASGMTFATTQPTTNNYATIDSATGSNYVFGTPPPVPDTEPPQQVAGLTVTDPGTGGRLNLAWQPAADNVGVDHYDVERAASASGPFSLVGSPSGAAFAATGLTDGTAYHFRVRAVDAAGNAGAYSGVASGTPTGPAPDTTPPSQVTGLTVTDPATGVTLNLAWTAATDDRGVTGYQVRRATAPGGPFGLVGSPSSPSFGDSGLTAGTAYYYVVRALDAAGNAGPDSAVASGTPTQPATCGTTLHDDGDADSTSPNGIREITLFSARETPETLTFCVDVKNFASRPTGTGAASQTNVEVGFTATYEQGSPDYFTSIVFNADGTQASADIYRGLVVGARTGSPVVTVLGNRIEVEVAKAIIGNPARGARMTEVYVLLANEASPATIFDRAPNTNPSTVTYTIDPPNRAPVVGDLPDQEATENTGLSFSVSASDADGDLLSLTAGLPPGAQVTGQAVSGTTTTWDIAWTPTYDQAGSYPVNVEVSDGRGGFATGDFTIHVANKNRAPVLQPFGQAVPGGRGVTGAEASDVAFRVAATDPDGSTPQMQAAGLPEGATFTDNGDGTGDFLWHPDYDAAGSYTFVVGASDGEAAVATRVYLTITDTNRAPSVNPVGDRSVLERQTLSFQVTGLDPDGDAVTLTVVTPMPVEGDPNPPPTATGWTFTQDAPGRGTFRWTPTADQSGTYSFTVTASDGRGLSGYAAFSVTVLDAPGFTFAATGATLVNTSPGKVVTFQAVVTNTAQSSDTFTFTVAGTPAGWSWSTPAAVTVDGGQSATVSFSATVPPNNWQSLPSLKATSTNDPTLAGPTLYYRAATPVTARLTMDRSSFAPGADVTGKATLTFADGTPVKNRAFNMDHWGPNKETTLTHHQLFTDGNGLATFRFSPTAQPKETTPGTHNVQVHGNYGGYNFASPTRQYTVSAT